MKWGSACMWSKPHGSGKGGGFCDYGGGQCRGAICLHQVMQALKLVASFVGWLCPSLGAQYGI